MNETLIMCPSESFILEKLTLTSKIKRQMSDSVATRSYMGSLETAQSSLKWIFISALVLNYFMNEQMMKYTMFLIRPLQLVLHLPLFRVVMPSNFSMLNGIIAPIMMFDILENEKGWDVTYLMKFDEGQNEGPSLLD